MPSTLRAELADIPAGGEIRFAVFKLFRDGQPTEMQFGHHVHGTDPQPTLSGFLTLSAKNKLKGGTRWGYEIQFNDHALIGQIISSNEPLSLRKRRVQVGARARQFPGVLAQKGREILRHRQS